MTKKANLIPVEDTTLAGNFNRLNDKFDNTLSLDGSTPNALNSDLDLNNNDILNAKLIQTDDITVGGSNVTGVLTRAETAADNAEASAEQAALDAAKLVKYDNISDMAASLILEDGDYVTVSDGANSEPETFLIDTANTATADGALIVALTGVTGRAISTRTEYGTYAELDGDVRSFPDNTILSVASGEKYKTVSSGQNITFSGGIKAVRVSGAVAATTGGVSASFQIGYGLSEIDGSLIASWVADGGVGFLNKIGSNNTSPVTGTWVDDTGYSAGQASYSAVMGGYDNIANGIASIVASQHSMVTSDSDHGTIIGGSVSGILAGSYGGIFSGTNNRLVNLRYDGVTTSVPSFSLIAGGSGNRVHMSHGYIFGGLNSATDGEFSKIIGANASLALGNFDTVLGSNSETRKGTLGGGQKNTIGGGRSNIIDSVTSPISNTIGGGENNETYGSFNSTGGGDGNDHGTASVSSNYGSIGGGLNNLNTAPNAGTISGGRDGEVTADYAAIPGGRGNKGTALYALGTGYQSDARHQAGFSMANGAFSVAGDGQASKVIRKAETSDNSATPMQTIVLPNDSTFLFTAHVVARRTDANDESAGYRIEGVIDRNASAASTALVGSITVTAIAEDVADWDVTAIANASSGGLSILVTGQNSKTIRWVAACDLVEVSG